MEANHEGPPPPRNRQEFDGSTVSSDEIQLNCQRSAVVLVATQRAVTSLPRCHSSFIL